MADKPRSNQPETATHEQRADRVVALFKTTMTVSIPHLSEKALHFMIVEAIKAAKAQDERERADHEEDVVYARREASYGE